MNKQSNVQPRKRSQIVMKLAILLVILFSTVALITTHVHIANLTKAYKSLQQQAMELEQANKELQNYIDNKNTDEGVKDVATGELGMVDPDTVIYDFD
jgi:cell division protein FtsL